MHEVLDATAYFAAFFGAATAGLLLHHRLPSHHRHERSHEVLRAVTGMIALIASVLLAFLVTSMQERFDKVDGDVQSYAADLASLDATMRDYGADTVPARDLLRAYTDRAVKDLWPGNDQDPVLQDTEAGGLMRALSRAALELEPSDRRQRILLPEIASEIRMVSTRRLLLAEQGVGGVPTPFLLLTGAWLTLCFAAFGFNAPRNGFVVAVLFFSTASLAAAMFLIIDLGTPFGGYVQVSPAPMLRALDAMRSG
ncbi:hypothetical protein [Rhizosaccharibacter radicis]|uniref:DUF4239 domain-containing protein n=1 Tax=Rhizosaccharibacter radicis TaxID=2782605 RepID=A0ABT1W170_9PROT|nr:DUF4239 domain-containing protein [Acetobacteraceae bacterium KSS12]